MKRIIKGVLVLIIMLSITTGCFKRDDMEGIQIYTTVYPITYIIDTLYGNYANISSIYPNGVKIENYELTDKQINDYSKGNLFIYNGLSSEKEIARKFLNKNKEMKIIDVSYGLNNEYSDTSSEELWLSPNNFLMLATTIKDNLSDFITSTYIKEEINTNYENIQEEVSLIDAELRSVGSSAKEKNKNINELINNYGAKIVSVDSMDVLTDDEVKNNEDYINIMKTFIKDLSD